MNPVVRGVLVYVFLLILFRIMGKKTLSEASSFDLVLLLIISEVTQQGLVGEDFSLTAAALLICTLMGVDLLITQIKQWFPSSARVIEGLPLVVVDNGKMLHKRMKKTHVAEDDILQAARKNHGLQKMEEIKYAILETDGSISIVPFEQP